MLPLISQEKEIKAQLERGGQNDGLLAYTPRYAHGTLFTPYHFFTTLYKLGIENHIPVMPYMVLTILIQQQLHTPTAAQMQALGKMIWNAGLPLLDDHLHNVSYDWTIRRHTK
jgi:hypothetical protein